MVERDWKRYKITLYVACGDEGEDGEFSTFTSEDLSGFICEQFDNIVDDGHRVIYRDPIVVEEPENSPDRNIQELNEEIDVWRVEGI